MPVLMIDNCAGTDSGLVGVALAEAGVAIDRRHPYGATRMTGGGRALKPVAGPGDALPNDASGHQALVVWGGPQNALADGEHPYLPHVVKLVRQFHDAGKPVLGVCLGSQIIARAFGAQNIIGAVTGRATEFGWQDVTLTEAGRADPVTGALPSVGPIFHWHSDTFSLPDGAVHLASSAMTANQAFRMGAKTYAIQFHFEIGCKQAEDWAQAFPGLIEGIEPGWLARRAALMESQGRAAEQAGLAMARAWVRLLA
jgi:GMP synthase (glutamine-hydrolysing)